MTEQSLAVAKPNIRSLMRKEDTIARFTEILGHNAPAYISSVLVAVANNTQLQDCEPNSVLTSAMRAATLRLSCDPATKQAHLVPFKGRATLVIGYKGIYDMAIRTGRYRYINDFAVYEGEIVTENRMTGIHNIRGGKTSERVIGYMLAFEMKNGFAHTFYMTVEEIQAHAARHSKTYNSGGSPWKTDFDKMARKTVIRLGLGKYGYFDPNDEMVMNATDEAEEGREIFGDPEPAVRQPTRTTGEIMRDLGYDDDPIKADPQTGEVLDGSFSDEQPIEEPAGETRSLEDDIAAGPPERPYPAPYLRTWIAINAKANENRQITEGKKGLIVPMLEKCFAVAGADERRRTVQQYLTGKAHLKDIPAGWLIALYIWLNPTKDQDGSGEWSPDPMAAREAGMVFAEANRADGAQGQLPL